jgi:hypothetical protein
MTIEELRAYIKDKHDKAFDTFLRETSGWCMKARLKHDSSARGVVDFALELLNLTKSYERGERMSRGHIGTQPCATCKHFAKGYSWRGYCKYFQCLEADWYTCEHWEGGEE